MLLEAGVAGSSGQRKPLPDSSAFMMTSPNLLPSDKKAVETSGKKTFTLYCASLPVIYMKSYPRHLSLQPLGKGSSFGELERLSIQETFAEHLLGTDKCIRKQGDAELNEHNCLLKELSISWQRQM